MTSKRLLHYLPMMGLLGLFAVFCVGLGAYWFGDSEQIVVQVTPSACLPGAPPHRIVF